MPHSSRALRLASASLALTACARAPAASTVGSEPRPEEHRGVAAPTSVPTATPPPTWTAHYQRQCQGSITPPVLSIERDEMVLCDARFSLERGSFEGSAPLGVLALLGDRAVTDDYGDGGLSLRDLQGQLVRHVGGGRPERVAVSADGRWLASVETTDDGQRLSAWSLPRLERVRSLDLDDAKLPLALSIDDDGRARWYGQRRCHLAEVPCSGGVGPCQQLECDPADGLRLEPDGTSKPWASAPVGLAALAVDPTGAWMLAIEASGRRWLRPVDSPTPRIELPGRSDPPEWPGFALALAEGARTIAISDHDGVELWMREAETVTPLASFPATGVEALVLTPAGTELLVSSGDGATVYRPGPALARSSRPTYDLPAPPGWMRAPVVDGEARWPEDLGMLWPPEPGIIAWYSDEDTGAELRVVVGDRAEFGRPELDPQAWARLVLERLDALPWEDGHIALPHTLRTWAEDGERRLELHYTTADGCEHYEVVRRVAEHGEWLVRHELHTFEGMPWRETWATMVHQPEGAPPAAPAP